LTKTFQPKDIVYFDDTRLIVMYGPYRDWDQPSIDKYVVANADLGTPAHLWGRQGYHSSSWGSDLMSEAEYFAFMKEDA